MVAMARVMGTASLLMGDTGSVAGAVEMAKLVPVVLRLFLYASPLRSITVATVMLRALDSSRGKRKIFGL